MRQEDAWDSLYSRGGRAWRGSARIPDPCGGDALDLGCGNGKTASTLIDLGYRTAGVDFSVEAVRRCRELFGDSARFLVSDIRSLPFGDRSFDYVTAVHAVEHLDDEGLLSMSGEAYRVLRPGGYLFVRTFTPDDMRSSGREGSEIRYVFRRPDEVVRFFGAFETVSSELVESGTRFGGVRSRAECLFRRPPGRDSHI